MPYRSSTPVAAGGRLHGQLLTQVVSAAEYVILSEAVFIPADDPGVQAPHAANATAAQISAADKSHASNRDDFSTYIARLESCSNRNSSRQSPIHLSMN